MTRTIDAAITFLPTRDLEECAAFYEGLLGLPLVLDQGACRIYRVGRAAYFGFCKRAAPTRCEGAILTLVSGDVDGWAERIRRAGKMLEKEPAHNETYGIYHLFVRDPDGHLVEIQRFDDASWSEGGSQPAAGP